MPASSPDRSAVRPREPDAAEGARAPAPGSTAPDASAYIRLQLLRAVAVLWTLFDETVAEINSELVHAGTAERVGAAWVEDERRYFLAGSDPPDTAISVFLCLPASCGHLFGGAYVKTSRCEDLIYLVPAIEAAQPRWLITATATECTKMVVHDLFASVLLGDVQAGQRTQCLAGFDLFQTPWS